MHDPMVQVATIPSPVPRRSRWDDASDKRQSVRRDGTRRPVRRWGWTRSRRTNDADLGRPTYPWWRLRGWGPLRIAGRAIGLREFVVIWHVEPRGADSGTVCRHYVKGEQYAALSPWRLRLDPFLKPLTNDAGEYVWAADRRWKLHLHHWHLSVRPWQRLRRRVCEGCEECGRTFGRSTNVISHQWDQPSVTWREWVRNRCRRVGRAYHAECSSLVHLRSKTERQAEALRWLAERWRVDADLDHGQFLHLLYRYSTTRPELPADADPGAQHSGEYLYGRRWMVEEIQRALGWQYDSERDVYVLGDGDDAPTVTKTEYVKGKAAVK